MRILAEYFGFDAEFIPRQSGRHTPDVKIGKLEWEIKSPLGGGKHTVEHQLARANKQSNNIVFDARRCKIHINKIRSQLKLHIEHNRRIKRLVLVTKSGEVEIIK